METRTERLIRALGSREAYAIVHALLQAEMTTSALAGATGISALSIERSLETLSQAALVSRRPGGQGAWYVTHWPETFGLLAAARHLGVAIAGTDDHADALERESFARLEAAGGAAAASRRGRPPRSG